MMHRVSEFADAYPLLPSLWEEHRPKPPVNYPNTQKRPHGLVPEHALQQITLRRVWPAKPKVRVPP
jgi:hypothetical protein